MNINNKDMIGHNIGLFTVLKRVDKPLNSKANDSFWLCKCECGEDNIIQKASLIFGRPKCSNCNQINKNENARIYTIWYGMIKRCSNVKSERYERYGGRGISVCNDWLNFESFKEWAINNGYDVSLTIDRIDNDGNYEPSNCKWSTSDEQNKNKSDTIKITVNNIEYESLKDVADDYGIKYQTLHVRYKKGLRGKELVRPVKSR